MENKKFIIEEKMIVLLFEQLDEKKPIVKELIISIVNQSLKIYEEETKEDNKK